MSHELHLRCSLPLGSFDLEVELTTDAGVTGVFGPSGAGKSSLLEVVAGLRTPARGQLRLGERVLFDTERGLRLPPEQRGVGYVPQEGLLFPHWSARANLLAGRRRAEQAERGPSFDEVVDLLGLRELLDKPVGRLSGGERQRVALGRALCSGPDLLLLDEPFASLDLRLRRRLLGLLVRVRDELRLPMLFVSHDPVDVQALCGYLLAIDRGRVVAEGEPWRVLTHPAVFGRADRFENLLPGRLKGHDEGTSRITLAEGVHLVAPRSTGNPGDRVLVSVGADDIIVAVDPPGPLSARNVLRGRVEGAGNLMGGGVLLRCRLADGVPLAVELTQSACADLRLEPGREVFLVIKTRSLHVVG